MREDTNRSKKKKSQKKTKNIFTNVDLEPFSPMTDAHTIDRDADLPEIPPGSNIGQRTARVDLHKTRPIRCPPKKTLESNENGQSAREGEK